MGRGVKGVTLKVEVRELERGLLMWELGVKLSPGGLLLSVG